MEGYKNYREIIIEGRGLDEQQASLNASTKALQQLAGVFMDVRETDQLDVVDQNGELKKIMTDLDLHNHFTVMDP